MARHNEVGKKGEDLTILYLVNRGYEILETNWRYSRAEIDIIAKRDEELVFVEVKTRSSDYFGPPEDFVDAKKKRLITTAAQAYMVKHHYEWSVRFDIVSILLRKEQDPVITHFEDAFFAGL